MQSFLSLRWLLGVGVLCVACGKSEPAPELAQQDSAPMAAVGEASQTAAAGDAGIAAPPAVPPAGTDSMQNAQQQMAQGMQAFATGMQQFASAQGAAGVKPVSFRELQAAFPELSGWEKGKSTGEMMNMPVAFSQAKVSYTKGESQIEAQIVDSSFHQMLIAPYSMMLTAGYEKETESGYEKSTVVAGQPGWEKWNASDKHGELNTIVSGRFIVTLEGSQLDDVSALHTLAGAMDTARLINLGQQSAKQ